MISKFTKTQLLLLAVFTVVVLFPLFPVPKAYSVSGHPWKVELVVFLVFTVVFAIIAIKKSATMVPTEVRHVRTTIAFFVLWSAASLFWAGSTWSVFHHTAVWAAYLFVFSFAAWILAKRDGERAVLASILLVGSVLGLLTILGYLQVVLNPRFEGEFRASFSKFSEILVLLGPFFFVVGAVVSKRILNSYTAAATISFTAVVVSLSRASFLSVIAGYIAALFLITVFLRHRPTLIRAGTILLVFAAIFSASQFLKSSKAEITLTGRFTSEKTYQTSSNDIRKLLIGISSEMIRANPFLGIGADNFGLELNRYRAQYALRKPDNPNLSAGDELMLERAHNEYLQIFAELGFVGIAIFAAFLISAGLSFKKRLSESGENIVTAIRLGAAAGCFAFLVSSLFSSFSFRAIQTGLVFFVVLAFAICPFRQTVDATAGANRYLTVIPQFLFSIFAAVLFGLQAVSLIYVMKAESLKELPDAAEAFSTAAVFDPNSAAIDMSLATRYFNAKDPGTAALYYREAIEKGAGVIAAYHYLAVARRMSGDAAGAENAMRECVRIYPRSVYARVFLSSQLRSNGKNKESDAELKRAYSMDKKSANTWESVFRTSALKTSIAARTDKDLVPLADLTPYSVVLAVIGTEKLYETTPTASL